MEILNLIKFIDYRNDLLNEFDIKIKKIFMIINYLKLSKTIIFNLCKTKIDYLKD